MHEPDVQDEHGHIGQMEQDGMENGAPGNGWMKRFGEIVKDFLHHNIGVSVKNLIDLLQSLQHQQQQSHSTTTESTAGAITKLAGNFFAKIVQGSFDRVAGAVNALQGTSDKHTVRPQCNHHNNNH